VTAEAAANKSQNLFANDDFGSTGAKAAAHGANSNSLSLQHEALSLQHESLSLQQESSISSSPAVASQAGIKKEV
jgi:hypothetical protein